MVKSQLEKSSSFKDGSASLQMAGLSRQPRTSLFRFLMTYQGSTVTILEVDASDTIDRFAITSEPDGVSEVKLDRTTILGNVSTLADFFGGIRLVSGFTSRLPTIGVVYGVAERLGCKGIAAGGDHICQSRERSASRRELSLVLK